jgi:hypothetical protein
MQDVLGLDAHATRTKQMTDLRRSLIQLEFFSVRDPFLTSIVQVRLRCSNQRERLLDNR